MLVAVPVADAAPYKNMLGLDFSKLSSPPSAVLSEAGGTAVPDLSNQDSTADTETLAAALVYAKSGGSGYLTKVCSNLSRVQGTESGARALAIGRGLQAYVLAADYVNAPVNCPGESTFRSWLSRVRTFVSTEAGSIIDCHNRRPNNWGMHCGASRIAADIYLGDTADLGRAAAVFHGWTGDRSAYAGFSYGDLSWQADPTHPVGINPVGAVKNGVNIDGVLPDDQRRGGPCCTLVKENYVYEALQGALVQAILLARQGYDAYNWQSQAIKRAYVWLYTVNNFPASGDDTWQIPLVNKIYGTSFSGGGNSWGKGMGAGAWLAPGLMVGSASDTTPPSTPSGLVVSNRTQTSLTLSWVASTDNVAVDHYNLTVNGAAAGTTTGTSATLAGLTCGTTYTLGVQAVDAAGNTSGTATVSGATAACSTPVDHPLAADADTYVDSGAPSANFGTAPTVSTDGSPIRISYFRFVIPAGVSLTAARLRLCNLTTSSTADTVRIASSNSWSETAITYNTRLTPTSWAGTTISNAAGCNTATIPVTQLVPGQPVTFIVTRAATSRIDRASRENATATNRPQLIVTY